MAKGPKPQPKGERKGEAGYPRQPSPGNTKGAPKIGTKRPPARSDKGC